MFILNFNFSFRVKCYSKVVCYVMLDSVLVGVCCIELWSCNYYQLIVPMHGWLDEGCNTDAVFVFSDN